MLTAEALQFVRDLEENNEREWFQPRKGEYERLLKEPMIEVVRKLNATLAGTAPDYVTDPAKSVYRIYRDTRFSKNKTPYKTHVSALLWHRRLGKDGGAGIYFHVSPKDFLIAGGLYRAEADMLLAVRQYIAVDYEKLDLILGNKMLRRFFGELQGDRLSRPPKGWTASHPALEYLKRKDLLLETALPPDAATGKGAEAELTKRALALVPFLDFLNAPLLVLKKRKAADPLQNGGWH